MKWTSAVTWSHAAQVGRVIPSGTKIIPLTYSIIVCTLCSGRGGLFPSPPGIERPLIYDHAFLFHRSPVPGTGLGTAKVLRSRHAVEPFRPGQAEPVNVLTHIFRRHKVKTHAVPWLPEADLLNPARSMRPRRSRFLQAENAPQWV